MHIELVPRHVDLLLVMIVTMALMIGEISVGFTVGVGGDRLVEHFQKFALLHIVSHVVQPTSQEDEKSDFAPKLAYPQFFLLRVHPMPGFVNLLPAGHCRLDLWLGKHFLNFLILSLLVIF